MNGSTKTKQNILSVSILVLTIIFCFFCDCFTVVTGQESQLIQPSDLTAPITIQSNSLQKLRTENTAPVMRKFALSACFDQAETSNKEIVVGRRNIPIAEAGVTIAGAIPNPQFNLQYGFGPAFTEVLAGETEQFGLNQRFQTAGKRKKAINLAKANKELAVFQFNTLRFDVHNRVRRAYAELAAAEAYKVLLQAQRETSQQLADMASKRFQSGIAPQAEVLQAKLAVLQFDTQLNQAECRLQQASAALSYIIGEVPEKIEVLDVEDDGLFKLSAERNEIVPAPSRQLPELSSLLPVGFMQRPDMKVAVQQVFANRRALTLARAQRIPDVIMGGGWAFSTFKKNQPGIFTGPVPFQQGVYINVTAENPIFYQHQGEIKQAKATWSQSLKQVEQTKVGVAADIVQAYNSVKVAKNNILIFQTELLPQATEVAKLARRRYELGFTDLSDAIIAQQQFQATRSSYFDTVVLYQNAWADLEKAVGVPLKL